MTTERILVASSANITHTAAEWLDLSSRNLVVYSKGDYGWFIAVCADQEPPDDMPMSLHDMLDAAANESCGWLMIDRDAAPLEGFPIYDW